MSVPTMSIETERGRTRLIIRCDYKDKHLIRMASFGTSTWRRKDKTHSCPADPVIAARVLEYIPEIRIDQSVTDWSERMIQQQQDAIKSTRDRSPLTTMPLVPFQMSSVRFLSTARRCILGHEMGTGKTPISCVALDYVDASKVLIVCPNSVKWSWVDHLRKWSSQRNIYVLESALVPGNPGAFVLAGNTRDREDHIAKTLTLCDECVLIVNYAQLRIHQKTFKAFDYDVIIADEAHRVNNRKAQQTEAFVSVARHAAYVWMLTGTPVRNRYTDLYTLLSVCDTNRFSSYWNFVNIYMQSVPGLFGGVEIIGLKDPERFNSMLSTFMYRVTKKEAMPQLPDKYYQDYRLVMVPKQHKLYAQMEQEFLISIEKQLEDGNKLETILRAPNVAAQLIRLRQICLTPEILGGPPESAKLEALKEIIEDLDGSFIIFTCFRKFIPYIQELLDSMDIPYGEIVGGQPSWERAEAERDLNSGKVRAIIGTIQSMGEGLNLQAASTAIFCDIDWVPAVNYQAEDRIHRGSITESPTIIRLFHPGTVEADIRSTCRRKGKIIEETTGQVEVIRQMLLRNKKS